MNRHFSRSTRVKLFSVSESCAGLISSSWLCSTEQVRSVQVHEKFQGLFWWDHFTVVSLHLLTWLFLIFLSFSKSNSHFHRLSHYSWYWYHTLRHCSFTCLIFFPIPGVMEFYAGFTMITGELLSGNYRWDISCVRPALEWFSCAVLIQEWPWCTTCFGRAVMCNLLWNGCLVTAICSGMMVLMHDLYRDGSHVLHWSWSKTCIGIFLMNYLDWKGFSCMILQWDGLR